jgi:hypothetical protein
LIERKYLFHFLDASFNRMTDEDGTPPTDTKYVRLGKHLEQYSEELNPQVSTTNNILGEQVTMFTGYQVSSTVEPYYADYGDPLWEKLIEIANERITGNGVETTRIDGLMDADGNVLWAYIETCKVIPTSVGGDTSGVQIPFQVHNNGNRHKVNFDMATKKATKFTE